MMEIDNLSSFSSYFRHRLLDPNRFK